MSKPYYEVGRYACKVTGQAMGETSTGKPQFILQFQVLGTVDPKNPANYIPAAQSYTRTHYRVITDKTIEYFITDLKTLGFQGASYKLLDPTVDGFHNFTGMDVDMWCAHDTDQNNEPREQWSVARVGGGELKVDHPLEPKKLRELDNLFGKHLKGLSDKPQSAPRSAASVTQMPSNTDADSVPF